MRCDNLCVAALRDAGQNSLWSIVCRSGAKMRIALVDDDPIELVLLRELSTSFDDTLEFEGHTTVRDFIESSPERYDLVFLDRRIPPHDEDRETLPMLASIG